MMRCHVLIPNLFWPDPDFRIEPMPYLETLLARGERTRGPGHSLEEWLCRTFKIRQQQDWPVAPLSLSSDTADLDYWLRADPVHLQLMRDEFRLVSGELLDISEAEASKLVGALNRHYEHDGLRFAMEAPSLWLVRLPAQPQLSTTPLPEVLGRDVSPNLPKGADAMRWNHIANEIQMLFHEHPVNEAREKLGQFPINSLWFWGGGIAPDVRQSPFASISANNAVARGLARQTGIAYSPLPENAGRWLSGLSGEGEHLVILDDLLLPAKYRDGNEWDARLHALEHSWFAPLHQAVQQGISLTLSDSESGLHFETGKLDLWKFWKRSRAVLDYSK